MPAQRSVEVDQVPVRVALAEERNVAADHAREPVAACVGADESLACEL
jgi:hypothetical protein